MTELEQTLPKNRIKKFVVTHPKLLPTARQLYPPTNYKIL